MSLTEEEKASLEEEKANMKVRCKEVWNTLQQLEDMIRTYRRIHDRWRERYERADRALAEEEKLKKYTTGGKLKEDLSDGVHLLVKLDRTQLERIKDEISRMEEGDEE